MPGHDGPNIRGATAARETRRRYPRPVHTPAPVATPQNSGLAASCAGLASGVAVSVAWWYPGTIVSAMLGWVAAGLLVYAVRAKRAYLPSYCCGLSLCALGFYWVYGTVSAFAGLGTVLSALVFAAFVVLSATQFLVFAFVHHNLGARLDAFALRSPIAVVLSELVSVRLFHWHYGHTQLAFTPFAQAASIAGAMLVTFLMFWLAEAAVRTVVFGERRRAFALSLVAFAASLGYGVWTIREFDTPHGLPQEVVLVQGNTAAADMFDPDAPGRNISRYHDLTRDVARPGALVVWPEGAVPIFLPEDIGSARNEPALPWGGGSAFLVGSYAFSAPDARYNAAFAVFPDGRVARPYFKQILIPFGEAMPFATVFPWLNDLNPKAAVFQAGTEIMVTDYPMRRADGTPYSLNVAPLICYEDTVPSLARAATRRGAELLVNLTYDTWFGRSVAADEHHLIAAFRAIENRRYLVRATNSGVSAVVDPLGRTIASIPPFTEGTVTADVRLLNDRTVYTRYLGETPWWSLLAVTVGVLGVRRWRGLATV